MSKDRTRITLIISIALLVALFLLLPTISNLSIRTQFPYQAPHLDVNVKQVGDNVVIGGVETKDFLGVSMIPTIFSRNTLIVKEYRGGELTEGIIVVADVNGELFAHRIVAVYNDEIILLGDNVNRINKIKKEDILYIIEGILFT